MKEIWDSTGTAISIGGVLLSGDIIFRKLDFTRSKVKAMKLKPLFGTLAQ